MIKIAMLDISPRQTGKTSRLIKQAQACLADGLPVRFVCLPGMKSIIQPQLVEGVVLEDGEAFECESDQDRAAWFYDEFDWLDSVELRPGAYYATTPRFVRNLGEQTPDNDILLRLLQANGNVYQRHTYPADMFGVLQGVRSTLPPDEFRHLYLGEFLA